MDIRCRKCTCFFTLKVDRCLPTFRIVYSVRVFQSPYPVHLIRFCKAHAKSPRNAALSCSVNLSLISEMQLVPGPPQIKRQFAMHPFYTSFAMLTIVSSIPQPHPHPQPILNPPTVFKPPPNHCPPAQIHSPNFGFCPISTCLTNSLTPANVLLPNDPCPEL